MRTKNVYIYANEEKMFAKYYKKITNDMLCKANVKL